MIFASALLFGPQVTLIAGGLGSALADLLEWLCSMDTHNIAAKGLEGYMLAKSALIAKAKAMFTWYKSGWFCDGISILSWWSNISIFY